LITLFCRFSFFKINFNCIPQFRKQCAADGKFSRFLFKTRSNLYYFVKFGSARDLNIFWKEEGRLSLKYPCINVRTLSLYVSSRLKTFSFENNGFECALKLLLLTALIAFFSKDLIFCILEFLTPPQVTIPYWLYKRVINK